MLAKGKRIPLFHFNEFLFINGKPELPHEHERFFRTDNLHLRITEQDLFNAGAVIGLHVVNN